MNGYLYPMCHGWAVTLTWLPEHPEEEPPDRYDPPTQETESDST
jgi:hypothetical protein